MCNFGGQDVENRSHSPPSLCSFLLRFSYLQKGDSKEHEDDHLSRNRSHFFIRRERGIEKNVDVCKDS